MRIVLTICLLSIMCVAPAGAVGIEYGCFSRDSVNRSVLSLQIDRSSGDFSLGYSLNANLSEVNYGMESVVVKYLEYDDGTVGIRYAPLEDMNFGYSLLLNEINTLYYQPSFLTNEQCGLRVYYDFNDFVVEGFGTYGHLYGARIRDFSMFNVNFGLEYLGDANMLSSESFGRSAYGAYIELPLTDEFSLIAESAASSNGGESNLAGVSFDYDLIFAYAKVKVAAISFNDRFIPGYFTTGYDLNPVDFASLEAGGKRRFGGMSTLSMGIFGVMALDYTNENYTDGGSCNSGSILITPLDRLSIAGYVKELSFRDFRPVKGRDSNMTGGMMEYKLRNGIYTSINYERSITEDISKPFETYYFKLGCNF